MGSRRDENRRLLHEFLCLPGVATTVMTDDIAERYGMLVSQLSRQGTPTPTNDIWIAAAVLETGARLVTYDSHFAHVPGVAILPR